MAMVVVFNSSPWIFLAKLDVLEEALCLFSQVYIPDSVNRERNRFSDFR
jgi:hypothetical protein